MNLEMMHLQSLLTIKKPKSHSSVYKLCIIGLGNPGSKYNNTRHNIGKDLLLNLSKRVVSDGEGASKFIIVNCENSKNTEDAKKISFSIANSALVKTAIAGEDPNWGRIAMAIGKSGVNVNIKKLSILIGSFKILINGNLSKEYDETKVAEYMKNDTIEITVKLGLGNKQFTVSYTHLTLPTKA